MVKLRSTGAPPVLSDAQVELKFQPASIYLNGSAICAVVRPVVLQVAVLCAPPQPLDWPVVVTFQKLLLTVTFLPA